MAARALSVGRASPPVARQAVGVAINGFGRIGRQVGRIAVKDPDFELKPISSSHDAEYLERRMKYDSIHGRRPTT